MDKLTREQMEALTLMFDQFALSDQRNYYQFALRRHQRSAAQVNRIRAFFTLLAGLASVIVGLVVATAFNSSGVCGVDAVQRETITAAQAQGGDAESIAALEEIGGMNAQAAAQTAGVNCDFLRVVLGISLAVTVIAPALGGAFTTLADLYQWDRLTTIYSSALENLEVADANSPNKKIPPDDLLTYRATMRAFAEGTLSVMRDEATQWGQAIRTPQQIEQFIREEEDRLKRANVAGAPAGGNRPDSGSTPAGGNSGTT
jgi:hypothetical protein